MPTIIIPATRAATPAPTLLSTAVPTISERTTANPTIDRCHAVLCSNNCTNSAVPGVRCGWSKRVGLCITDGHTNPDNEVDLGICPPALTGAPTPALLPTLLPTAVSTISERTTATTTTPEATTSATITPTLSISGIATITTWTTSATITPTVSSSTTDNTITSEPVTLVPSAAPSPTPSSVPTSNAPTIIPTQTPPLPTGVPATLEPTLAGICVSITCSDQCSGVCGWSKRVGQCIAGGYTNPKTELRLGDCSQSSTAPAPATPSTSEPTPAPATAVICASITCSDYCSGVCGWSRAQGGCIAGGYTNARTELGLGDCSFGRVLN